METKVLSVHAWRGTRADYERQQVFVVVPAGHTIDDVMGVHYWRHHVAKLNRFDLIEAVAVDNSFDLGLRVVKVGKDGDDIGKVWVRPLWIWRNEALIEAQEVEAVGDLPTLPDGYSIGKGPGGRYRVKRAGEMKPLKDGLASALEAHQWAIRHAEAA